MKIHKEIKEIAKCIAKIDRLADELVEKTGIEGVCFETAEFVSLTKEQISEFDENEITEDYYVKQWAGYCEDDYRGYLWFKTDVPGMFVRVWFEF